MSGVKNAEARDEGDVNDQRSRAHQVLALISETIHRKMKREGMKQKTRGKGMKERRCERQSSVDKIGNM
jgi:hypothetical protein